MKHILKICNLTSVNAHIGYFGGHIGFAGLAYNLRIKLFIDWAWSKPYT